MGISLEERIEAFDQLGKIISNLTSTQPELIYKANIENSWFTEQHIAFALKNIGAFLTLEKLNNWLSDYQFDQPHNIIAIICAGNIPLVSFHDILCVLISGNKAQIKLSSQDKVLLPFILDQLIAIQPDFKTQINFVEQLSGMDAVIATGSNNTARYFDYYFGKYPHIIRKNRTSIAVLKGDESAEELKLLGQDMLMYFGMGCRNVTKLLVPDGYDFNALFEALGQFDHILNHSKYASNYEYHKAIHLIEMLPHLDTGFLLFKEAESIFSPLSCVHYSYYKSVLEVDEVLVSNSDQIQCIVAREGEGRVPFGAAQSPDLHDYADQIDTLAFLSELQEKAIQKF